MGFLRHIIDLITVLLLSVLSAVATPMASTASHQAEFCPHQETPITEYNDLHFAARAPPKAVANVEITGAAVSGHGDGIVVYGHETNVPRLGFGVGLDVTNKGEARTPWSQISSDSRAIIRDIEGHSGVSVPTGQRLRLADQLRNRNHTVPATSDEYAQLQRQYNSRRASLRREWEQNTGQHWPKDASGNNYQAHHVIPSRYGGPNEWWNLHPVPRATHQGGVHAKGSPTQGVFPTPVPPQ